jgi:hypothetical protein
MPSLIDDESARTSGADVDAKKGHVAMLAAADRQTSPWSDLL